MAYRSENVGMSSEKTRENRVRRKSKVSDGRLIRVGLVGPKSRLRSVDDGQQVNNPVPRGGATGGRRRVGQPEDGRAGARSVGRRSIREKRKRSLRGHRRSRKARSG
jgi:hypothetical protein